MSREKVKDLIQSTYTPEQYLKMFLCCWAMVGEGFIVAENTMDIDKFPEELLDRGDTLDALAISYLEHDGNNIEDLFKAENEK